MLWPNLVSVKREDSLAGCVHHEFDHRTTCYPESPDDRFGKFAETGTHFLENL
jgi:hypothetical protein